MNDATKHILAHFLMAAACLIFGTSTVAMLYQLEPFYSGYYSFAWWSYIIFIESFLYCRGSKSLLFENPREFLLLVPFSTTLWLVFESLNFRLSNWHYINIPSDTAVRWTGYFVAYSTVLPGIFSTKDLIEHFGVLKNSKTAPVSNPPKLYKPFILTGIFFLILPLVWPGYFFPLVWGAFIFLLEPVNHWAGASSLLREWEKGSLRNFYLLFFSGVVCGLLWELWNFRAGSKWIYTVPHFAFLKVFEMPLLGFFGFPPFAVECYAMTAGFFLLISSIGKKYPPPRALCLYAALAAGMVLFDVLVFAGIDRLTVISFQDFAPFGARP